MLQVFERRETLLGAILVATLAFLAFASTIGNEFVWTDEETIVGGSGILRSGADVARVFSGPIDAGTQSEVGAGRSAGTSAGAAGSAGATGGYYRPIAAISITIDHALFGKRAAGFHAVNVLLHAAATLFLFLFLSRLFPKGRAPFLAALLFAVHPIQTESVAWISARSGLLAAAWLFVALYLYARYTAERLPAFLYGSLGAAAIALLSKESAVVLPLLVLAARAFLRRPGERFFDLRREGGFFALLAIYLAIRWAALGALGSGSPRPIAPEILAPTTLRVLAGYVGLLLFPVRLHTNDAVRLSTSPIDARAFLSLVFLAAALYGFLRLGRDRRETRFGLLWLGIACIPLLNILPLLHFRAERFLYLPSAGFCLAAAALIDRWGEKLVGPARRLGLAPGELVTAALVLVLAFGSVARSRTWKDDYALFDDTLRKTPYAPEATYRLGLDAYRGGAYQEASTLLRASLALDPAFVAYLPVARAEAALGYAEYKAGRAPAAAAAFREALRLAPNLEEARFGLALVASAAGAPTDALRTYREILAADPTHEDARYNLALAYEAVDSLGPAEAEYRRLLDRNPGRKDAQMNLGSILARTGRLEEALQSYRTALRLSPTDARIHFNIGLLFALGGEHEGAAQALRTAIELDPTYVEAKELLAEVEAGGPEPAQPSAP